MWVYRQEQGLASASVWYWGRWYADCSEEKLGAGEGRGGMKGHEERQWGWGQAGWWPGHSCGTMVGEHTRHGTECGAGRAGTGSREATR